VHIMKPDPSKICFGLSEEVDQQSLATFLRLGGQEEFSRLFAARLASDEILQLVDLFMSLLRKHLSEDEYHRIFLGDSHHHDHKE